MHKTPRLPRTIRPTKLALRRETIAYLTAHRLAAVVGGILETLSCNTCDNACELSQAGVCPGTSDKCGGA